MNHVDMSPMRRLVPDCDFDFDAKDCWKCQVDKEMLPGWQRVAYQVMLFSETECIDTGKGGDV